MSSCYNAGMKDSIIEGVMPSGGRAHILASTIRSIRRLKDDGVWTDRTCFETSTTMTTTLVQTDAEYEASVEAWRATVG